MITVPQTFGEDCRRRGHIVVPGLALVQRDTFHIVAPVSESLRYGKQQAVKTESTSKQEMKRFVHVSEIEQRLEVCGGDACVQNTRIAVWVLEQWRRMGCSDKKIIEMYPALNSEQLKAAWRYVKSHKDEIDTRISENEDD